MLKDQLLSKLNEGLSQHTLTGLELMCSDWLNTHQSETSTLAVMQLLVFACYEIRTYLEQNEPVDQGSRSRASEAVYGQLQALINHIDDDDARFDAVPDLFRAILALKQ